MILKQAVQHIRSDAYPLDHFEPSGAPCCAKLTSVATYRPREDASPRWVDRAAWSIGGHRIRWCPFCGQGVRGRPARGRVNAAAIARLRWAIVDSGLSQFAVERAASPPLAPGTLSHVLRGRRRLTQDAAQRLEVVFHVRAAWLLFGKKPAWWLVRAADGRCAINKPSPLPVLAYSDEEGSTFRFTDRSVASRMVSDVRSEANPFNGFDTVQIVAVTPNIDKGARS